MWRGSRRNGGDAAATENKGKRRSETNIESSIEREIRTRGKWLSFDLRRSGTLEGRPSQPQPSSGTEG
jgi:hypothetical protein